MCAVVACFLTFDRKSGNKTRIWRYPVATSTMSCIEANRNCKFGKDTDFFTGSIVLSWIEWMKMKWLQWRTSILNFNEAVPLQESWSKRRSIHWRSITTILTKEDTWRWSMRQSSTLSYTSRRDYCSSSTHLDRLSVLHLLHKTSWSSDEPCRIAPKRSISFRIVIKCLTA